MPRKVKCSYREGGRRCPFEGDGNPPLCQAHKVALQEAARPRSASSVLAEAAVNFLQGKPINRDATIGAFDSFINQWAGMGADYRPDVNVGESEDSAHRRARPGAPPWWGARQRQAAPDPRTADYLRAIAAARGVLGFAPNEPLDEPTIKARQRQLAKRYHPDRAGRDAAKAEELTKRTAVINQAANILLEALEHQRQR